MSYKNTHKMWLLRAVEQRKEFLAELAIRAHKHQNTAWLRDLAEEIVELENTNLDAVAAALADAVALVRARKTGVEP